MTQKHKNLQPWIDYFKVLQTYEQKGFLKVMPDKREAYITQPALHALSDGDDLQEQIKETIPETVLRIRGYAGWRSQEGEPYLKKNFALHVVEPEHPHDLIYTLLLTQSRRWLKLWRKTDSIEVISYQKKKQE